MHSDSPCGHAEELFCNFYPPRKILCNIQITMSWFRILVYALPCQNLPHYREVNTYILLSVANGRCLVSQQEFIWILSTFSGWGRDAIRSEDCELQSLLWQSPWGWLFFFLTQWGNRKSSKAVSKEGEFLKWGFYSQTEIQTQLMSGRQKTVNKNPHLPGKSQCRLSFTEWQLFRAWAYCAGSQAPHVGRARVCVYRKMPYCVMERLHSYPCEFSPNFGYFPYCHSRLLCFSEIWYQHGLVIFIENHGGYSRWFQAQQRKLERGFLKM